MAWPRACKLVTMIHNHAVNNSQLFVVWPWVCGRKLVYCGNEISKDMDLKAEQKMGKLNHLPKRNAVILRENYLPCKLNIWWGCLILWSIYDSLRMYNFRYCDNLFNRYKLWFGSRKLVSNNDVIASILLVFNKLLFNYLRPGYEITTTAIHVQTHKSS